MSGVHGARQQDLEIEGTGSAAGVQNAVLHCMLPGGEAVMIGVDAVAVLMGVVGRFLE